MDLYLVPSYKTAIRPFPLLHTNQHGISVFRAPLPDGACERRGHPDDNRLTGRNDNGRVRTAVYIRQDHVHNLIIT